MNLSDRDKEIIKQHLDRGEPLPPKYRLMLFADAPEVELIWQGKTSEVTNVVLPFQSIEQIDEPRREGPKEGGLTGAQDALFAADARGRQSGGWTNKLIWGDNKLVLSSLKNGPLRREIEDAGGLKLIYIDPPFNVDADFSVDIEVGDHTLTKEASVIEELAYRDTWGRGTDSYLAMLYERLCLMRDLLSSDGSIYVHVGPNVAYFVRSLMREVFGSALSGEIVWQRTSSHGDSHWWGVVHDTILFFTKSEQYTWNEQRRPFSAQYIESHYGSVEEGSGRRFAASSLTAAGLRSGETGQPWRGFDPNTIGRHWGKKPSDIDQLDSEGRIYWPKKDGGWPREKLYLEERDGVAVSNIWDDIPNVNSQAKEDTGYDTQKPQSLLDRIIRASSNEGDLIADFFCGSGTTLAVAEKLGRKWIGCDLGRFAIHTTRKRLIGVQRELKAAGKPYRSFEILNLGKYERQYFVSQLAETTGGTGVSPVHESGTGETPVPPDRARRELALRKEEQYLNLILSAYKAERVFQMPPFHGRQGRTMVVVGPIDSPVTESQVDEIIAACLKQELGKVDVLGFEFVMGLTPAMQDEAKHKGIALSLKYIPKDVFDKRAVEKGQVTFYDVAYVETRPEVKGLTAKVKLEDFGVFYQQDDMESLGEKLKPGGSKVTVESGQVVKITKDKSGKAKREVLTKKWTDWIDYWAVDFDYENRKEILRVPANGGTGVSPVQTGTGETPVPPYEEVWTGNYVFENEWQSFRTRKDRKLELTSAAHEYPKKGKYKIAVKVIDIFGNDTTKVVEVKV